MNYQTDDLTIAQKYQTIVNKPAFSNNVSQRISNSLHYSIPKQTYECEHTTCNINELQKKFRSNIKDKSKQELNHSFFEIKNTKTSFYLLGQTDKKNQSFMKEKSNELGENQNSTQISLNQSTIDQKNKQKNIMNEILVVDKNGKKEKENQQTLNDKLKKSVQNKFESNKGMTKQRKPCKCKQSKKLMDLQIEHYYFSRYIDNELKQFCKQL